MEQEALSLSPWKGEGEGAEGEAETEGSLWHSLHRATEVLHWSLS